MYRSLISLMPKAQPLLLDLFPNASVAYSLRKLRTAYSGSAIRVRRSSDNTEQDIGFVGNNLDTTSLLTFCGAGNGFVTTWYDQSTNGNNATQTTAGSQPRIVNGGVVDKVNNKPCAVFDGSNDNLVYSSYIFSGSTARALFTVYKPNNSSGTFSYGIFGQSFGTVTGSWSVIQSRTQFVTGDPYFSGYSADLGNGNSTPNTSQKLGEFLYNGTNGTLYKNASQLATGALTLNALTTGRVYIGTSFTGSTFENANANIQEAIAWSTDQSTNRTAIETNINSHYNIYP